MTPQASTLVQIGIPALALAVVSGVGFAVHKVAGARAASWFTLAAALWLVVSAALGVTGFLAHFGSGPPRILALMLPTLLLPALLAFSSTGTALAQATPLWLLIGFQGFRLPLELVMHRAALEGTMPPQMTYTGSNFDIVSGASAIAVGLVLASGRAPDWLVVAWNVLGSVLLAAILVIAVASLPALHAFGSEPALVNTWVAYFPYVWLPAGLVSAALLGHLLLWRRLLSGAMRGRALAPLS